MSIQTILLISFFTNMACLFGGYGIGMIKERLGWHNLIKQGKIPSPAYWGARSPNGLIRIKCRNKSFEA